MVKRLIDAAIIAGLTLTGGALGVFIAWALGSR